MLLGWPMNCQRERALRRLPLPYSLALRLRDAGVAADVICQYIDVEQVALDGLYHMAEAKLVAAQNGTRGASEAAERTKLRSLRWEISATTDLSAGREAGAQDRDGSSDCVCSAPARKWHRVR